MSLIDIAADAVMPRWQRLLLGAAAGVLVLSAVAGGAFYEGWSMRGDREAAAALKAKEKTDAVFAAERLRGDGLALQLEDEKRNVKTVTVEVVKEIPKVTTVYVEVPGEAPKPIPPAVITFGAVRLFNRALRPDLPAGSSEFAYPAGATDLTRARVDLPDVLGVHAENAGKFAECRAQLNKLIDFELGRQKALEE